VKGDATTRLRGMLGFATRAGKVVFGAELVCSELKKGPARIRLALVSFGASDGTKKKIRTKCEFYGVPQRELPMTGEELGDLLGKSFAPAVIALTDEGFAKEISAALDSLSQDG